VLKINNLKNKKIAIWGAGSEGLAVLRVLQHKMPESDITILNDKPISENVYKILEKTKPGVSLMTGEAVKTSLENFDVIIKSPGVSIYRPEVIAAKEKGVYFTSSTQLWFHEHANEKIIAVTGSKGKSTTTSLIAHMLKALGYDVILAGNIGIPLIEMLDEKPDFWVLEMSSYQTSDFVGSVSVAVLLNLYPEHLDWHGTVENYYRDKWNLLQQVCNGTVILNDIMEAGFPRLRSPSRNLMVQPTYFNHSKGLHVQDSWIYDNNEPIIATDQIPLKGEHNISNLCAALTVLKSFNLDLKEAVDSLTSFQGLPHRLTVLGEKDDILYVDDSISTIPQAAIAAMEAFKNRPISILLGGYDRGVDMTELIDYLFEHPIHLVITMPESGERIARSIRCDKRKSPFRLYEVKDLEQAIEMAQKNTPKGGIILLSPAAPSYHAFKNFKERGNSFSRMCGVFT
jgi:UDP-N-acetylmuramoylalanine--D-glutamate ligase